MAISNQDLEKGVDFSGKIDLEAVDCNNLVDQATPASDKGLIVTSTDVAGNPTVPDAVTTTKWQRYAWLRITATVPKLYIWNPNAATDATYLKWLDITAVALGPGIITNAMLAGGITFDKIASVLWASIINTPSFLDVTTVPAAGDIAGTYQTGLTIVNDKVTTPKILDGAVTPAKLAPTMGYQLIQTLYAEDSALKTIDAGGTAAYIIPNDDTIPAAGEGFPYMAMQVAITPKRATSLLVVEFETYLTGATSPSTVVAAICRDAGNAIAAGWTTVDTIGYLRPLRVRLIVVAGSTAATTFKVNVGPTSAVIVYLNGQAGGRKFGGVMVSRLTVQELYL